MSGLPDEFRLPLSDEDWRAMWLRRHGREQEATSPLPTSMFNTLVKSYMPPVPRADGDATPTRQLSDHVRGLLAVLTEADHHSQGDVAKVCVCVCVMCFGDRLHLSSVCSVVCALLCGWVAVCRVP